MQKIQYEVVPNIITGKDLDYLTDMFDWNYGALKKMNTFINSAQNEDVKNMLKKGYQLFQNNLNQILTILSEGGSYE